MEPSEPALRRSKREHQPSAKAAAASAASSLPPAPSGASRRSQRRRVTRSASPASTPASTHNSSPVQGPVASPASSNLVSSIVDSIGPNGQRRRLRAAAHTGSNSGVIQGVHSVCSGLHDDGKVLGRYSSHGCALLCEVIMSQLKKQTLAPTVLEETKSPAFIRWEPVARKMETTHKLRLTPKECQLLWKFLAYGEIPVVGSDELLPDSDEEDFIKTPKEINVQVANRRAKAGNNKTDETAAEKLTEEGAEQAENGKTGAEQEKKHEEAASDVQEKESAASVQLCPTYTLPTGAPDAWYRPFTPKDALPLTFVASRFLRRKPNPPVQARVNAAGQVSAAELKRKSIAPATSAAVAKKTKLPTPPREFTPSSTPPPAAQRARSELEFFELRLRQELGLRTPGARFNLTAADIQRRFGEAPADVRRQCQTLAAHDIERFNREVVRGRIWQKAMGGNSTKPQSALAPTPSKPVAVATSKSSGPTAALLAHTAAVTANAAKATKKPDAK
ncbi:hypothetical protein V7S43_002448 [Phytophthora oleae]|uniref:Uncharacterized protein n=1 Tax=Phytophthora oleae TaxID=2107226 RepID=A0ABD3G234_9STRA